MIPGGQPMSMGGQAQHITLSVAGPGHLITVDSSKFPKEDVDADILEYRQ